MFGLFTPPPLRLKDTTSSPLYPSSSQAEGHNIFASLPPQDEKEVLDLLKQSIIATDLALYFGNRTTLQSLHDDNKLVNFSFLKPSLEILLGLQLANHRFVG